MAANFPNCQMCGMPFSLKNGHTCNSTASAPAQPAPTSSRPLADLVESIHAIYAGTRANANSWTAAKKELLELLAKERP